MRSFQTIRNYASTAATKVTSATQCIWQNNYVQAACQGVTAPVYSCASYTNQKISAAATSVWQHDYVQATYQGFTAPIYSYASAKRIYHSSQDVKNATQLTFWSNGKYALQAVAAYFLYYRMAQPLLNYGREQLDTESGIGSAAGYGLSALDMLSYLAINVYLVHLWLQNAVQNFSTTSTITGSAAKAMPASEDFKPCECSNVQVARADGDSLLFYMGNRYVVGLASNFIEGYVSGYKGQALAFTLQALSFGWPLVEHKYSAVGKCTEHRYKDVLRSYKQYCFMYGASFVTATLASNYIFSKISGKYNPYSYDAVFSFMFQMYALLAIAREKKFPGNDYVAIDVLAWINCVINTRPVQKFIDWFMGDLYTIERLVQTPGVGLLLSTRENEIKEGISTVKGGIKQIRDIQSSRWMTTLKWVGNWIPYQVVPPEITTVCKSFSKTAASRLIRKIEYWLEIARDAEIQRSVQRTQSIAGPIENHFATPEEKKREQATIPPLLPFDPTPVSSVAVASPQAIRSKPEVERKLDLPEPGVTQVVLAGEIKIDSTDYFLQQKAPVKPLPALLVSQNGSTLFGRKEAAVFHKNSRNDARRPGSLASLTASIISNNTAKCKVLRQPI